MTPIEYYQKVPDHLDQMSAFQTIDQDEIEAELKKTKPRSPRRFANDLYWKTFVQCNPELRRSVRISRPSIRDPEDNQPPTLPDHYNKKRT